MLFVTKSNHLLIKVLVYRPRDSERTFSVFWVQLLPVNTSLTTQKVGAIPSL